MSNFDFNNAGPQTSFELIPDKTIVPLCMTIRPGGVGEGGWLTASKSSDAQLLNCEFTVTEGPFAKRKVFQYFTLSGGQLNEKGESKGGNISRTTLRAILESSRNVNPEDMSESAVAKRRTAGWQDFQGLVFLARLGVEKGKDGYQDKNKILTVLTPDMKDYAPIGQYTSPAHQAVPSEQAAWGQAPVAPAQAKNPVPSWAL